MTWQKIKCFFGFHDWKLNFLAFYRKSINAAYIEKQCGKCGTIRSGVIL